MCVFAFCCDYVLNMCVVCVCLFLSKPNLTLCLFVQTSAVAEPVVHVANPLSAKTTSNVIPAIATPATNTKKVKGDASAAMDDNM